MNRNVEDILAGDDPKKDLEKESVGKAKTLGYRIIRVLELAKTKELDLTSREQLWERIEGSLERGGRKKALINKTLKLTVSAACFLFIFYFLFWNTSHDTLSSQSALTQAALSKQHIPMDTGGITMRASDHNVLALDDHDIIDLVSSDNSKHSSSGNENSYNTLTVPYGKRTEVVLPDSSKVWLNAGSQLTFRSNFEADKREVYLEGEGYFDVKAESDRPFYVHTSDLLIRVLGTTFNVSSYRDDSYSSAVLLTGKIELGAVEGGSISKILEPGSKAILQRESRELSIRRENVEDQISWTKRQLILKNTPLEEIRVRLERIYNTKILVEDATFADETFSGRLDLTQPLTSLLIALYTPNEYDIQNGERRIIIQRK